MKITSRILLSFGVATAVSVVVGALAFRSASTIGGQLARTTRETLPALDALTGVREAQAGVMLSAYQGRVARSAEMRQMAIGSAQVGFDAMAEASKAFQAIPRSPEVETPWAAAQEPGAEWRRRAQAALEALQARDAAATSGDEAALAQAIRDALADPPRLARMSADSRALAEEFSWDRIAERTVELYREL